MQRHFLVFSNKRAPQLPPSRASTRVPETRKHRPQPRRSPKSWNHERELPTSLASIGPCASARGPAKLSHGAISSIGFGAERDTIRTAPAYTAGAGRGKRLTRFHNRCRCGDKCWNKVRTSRRDPQQALVRNKLWKKTIREETSVHIPQLSGRGDACWSWTTVKHSQRWRSYQDTRCTGRWSIAPSLGLVRRGTQTDTSSRKKPRRWGGVVYGVGGEGRVGIRHSHLGDLTIESHTHHIPFPCLKKKTGKQANGPARYWEVGDKHHTRSFYKVRPGPVCSRAQKCFCRGDVWGAPSETFVGNLFRWCTFPFGTNLVVGMCPRIREMSIRSIDERATSLSRKIPAAVSRPQNT